jgi:transcription elongation factor Elf1
MVNIAMHLVHTLSMLVKAVVQVLERLKGAKVNSTLTCLVCGQETKVTIIFIKRTVASDFSGPFSTYC